MTPAEILQLALSLNLTEHVSTITDPARRASADAIQQAYTGCVAALRESSCAPIRALGIELWDAVGGKRCQVAVFEPIKSIHLTVYRQGDTTQPCVLLPPQWVESIRTDPITCVGGVIFTGSQALTWLRTRRIDPHINDTAMAIEAEYLLTIRTAYPLHPFTHYQRQVLGKYPRGLASLAINT